MMQAINPALLTALSKGGNSYVRREFMPTQDKLDLEAWKGAREEFGIRARDLGFLVAWAQLRSGGRGGSATIDALIRFARNAKWRRRVVEYAKDYESIVRRDWKKFRAWYADNMYERIQPRIGIRISSTRLRSQIIPLQLSLVGRCDRC